MTQTCCGAFDDGPLSQGQAARLAGQFAAIADPVRLQLLNLLANASEGAVCACDLVPPVGRSQPTVSHHLRVLAEAGLVTSERRGRNIWYAAAPAAISALRDSLALQVTA